MSIRNYRRADIKKDVERRRECRERHPEWLLFALYELIETRDCIGKYRFMVGHH